MKIRRHSVVVARLFPAAEYAADRWAESGAGLSNSWMGDCPVSSADLDGRRTADCGGLPASHLPPLLSVTLRIIPKFDADPSGRANPRSAPGELRILISTNSVRR